MLDFLDSRHQLMHIVVETRLVDNELMKIVISGKSNLTKGRIAVHTIRLIVITKWNMYPRDQYDRRAKFRRNRSKGCGDRAIYRFFPIWRPSAILDSLDPYCDHRRKVLVHLHRCAKLEIESIY